MKKSMILAAAILGLVACNGKIELVTPDNENTIINSPAPLVFTASIGDTRTKTAIQTDELNNGKVFWVTNDQININGKAYKTTADGVTTASFTAVDEEASPIEEYYNAYYPNVLFNGGTPSLPLTQIYSAVGANCPMYARSATTTLDFKNLCGVVKITINSATKLKSIRLDANEYISGPFTITSDAAVVSNETGKKYVYLDCSNGGEYVDIAEAKTFYIALPAGTYTGFKMTFTDKNDDICIKTKKTALEIVRNQIESITLNTALAFTTPEPVADPTVTYYNMSSTIENPVEEGEGSNTGFNVVNADQNNKNFKHTFSTTNGNAVNWKYGDKIEAKIDVEHSADKIFVLGNGNAWGNDGPIIYADWLDNGWGFLGYAKPGQGDRIGSGSQRTTLWVRVSKENGYEYSYDGTNYTCFLDKNDPYLSNILTLGAETPLYLGAYGNTTNGVYNYLKITRYPAPAQEDIPVSEIVLSKTSADINIELESYQLSATVLPEIATDRTIVWTSDDESVAVVDATGKVTPKAAGEATITATASDGSGVSASCVITVTDSDEDEEIVGNVTYYSRNGKKHNEAQEFTSSDEKGFNFPINGINWSGGDVLEIKLVHKGSEGQTGRALCIGEDLSGYANIYGKNFVYFSAFGDLWFGLLNSSNGQYGGAGTSKTVIIRMSLGTLQFSVDGGTSWTTANEVKNGGSGDDAPTAVGKVQALDPIYLGCNGTNVGCKFEYIKVTKAGAIAPAGSNGSNAGNTIDKTQTTW